MSEWPKGLWADDFLRIRQSNEMSQLEIGNIFYVDQGLWSKYENAIAEPPLGFVKRVMEHFDDYELRIALMGMKMDGLLAIGYRKGTEENCPELHTLL